MMAAVDLCAADGSTLDPNKRTGWHIYQAAINRGALLRPLGDTLYLFPPLNTTMTDIKHVLQVLDDSVRSVLG
jgi:adenosylmethionine-8-amino-7-oxononanoate aminotransferase